jgi:hypothetical protein
MRSRLSLDEMESSVWGPSEDHGGPTPGPPGHGCTSFTIQGTITPAADLERRRLAAIKRWKFLLANQHIQPTRDDVLEYIAVGKALGRTDAQIARFTQHFPEHWFQYPYRRLTWRELHELYDATTPWLTKPGKG